MTAVTDTDALPRKALAGPFGGLFCGYLGLTAAIPVLPGFVRDRYDASDFLVGLVVTATALTALLIRPLAGGQADYRGNRLVMQVGAVLVALGGLAYFLPIGLAGLVLDRLMLGVGEAALFTAGAVWVVSLAPHSRRAQLIGLYGVSMWGGISAGTFLGALLHNISYSAVWTLCTVAPLVGLALISSAPAPARPTGPRSKTGLMLRPALTPGLALALAAGGYAALAAFVVLHLDDRGIGSGVVVLSCFSLVYAGTRLFIGRFPDKYGPRRVATVCAVSEAIGLLIIAVTPNLLIALLGSVVMGVGFSLLHPSLALMVMNRTARTQQGAALGAYTSFWDLGVAVWGPVGGVIAGVLGYEAVFVVGACCAGVSAVMALLIAEPSDQPVTVA
ncbi:MFS transporter [Jatrophihabitans sp.]|uniref:MFS transporter n=1 Tax=Jatrophihabitans sp. TaxID=1932789 RepID=UPI002C692572|nr:MFS transporter [Jatrophihabitans sp.]